MSNDYIFNLSDEQKKPLNRESQNAVILAAAGSGKTRTLTHLLLDDIAKGIPASEIIAFTFTEKAADELLARIYKLALEFLPDVKLDGIFIGTIHSWCLQYLSNQSDFYNFTPIDELQVDALVSRFYDALKIKESYDQSYPLGIPSFLADVEVFYNEDLKFEQVPDQIAFSIQTYIDLLRNNRLMTFGDMVRSAILHLQKNEGVPNLTRLYVDEYQDVNPAQVNLIKAMASNNTQIVVVGDDLQCIYNWRGSDVSRIINFSQDFEFSSIFRLSENYRSRPGIVHIANQIATDVSLRDASKQISPKRKSSEMQEIFWLNPEGETQQAELIAEIISRFKEAGVPENKIAILMRSVIKHGKPIVQNLRNRDIKFYAPLLSRGGKFIDEFLLPLLDWLRKDRKEPVNQIEEDLLEKENIDLWNCAKGWVSPDLPNSEETFWDNLTLWYALISDSHNDAYDVRGRLYDLMDACKISVSAHDSDLMVGLGIASQIIRSVEEIHRRRIFGFNRRTAKGVITEVYFALKRNKEDFGESLPIDINFSEGVLVTTIHQAKGLEWPVVIIPMLVNKNFPHSNTGHGTSYPDEIAYRYGTNLDDERRLFYVATTRAKEKLFLLSPTNHDPKKTSKFLIDLQGKGAISESRLDYIDNHSWHIDSEDLKEETAPPIRIGLSDLLIYTECPYQYGLRRIVSVQPSVGEELGFGKGLHELIQRHYEDKPVWSEPELNKQVNDNVLLPLMSEDGEKKSQKAIKNRIRRLEALGIFDAEVETEVSIEVPLKNGVIHGIIDLIIKNHDGTLTVRDWKSNIHENLLPRYDKQLQFYFYALKKQNKNVRNADIVDIGQTNTTGVLSTHIVNNSQEAIDELIRLLDKAMEGISRSEFHPTPDIRSCSCCDMARICAERFIL